MRVIGFEASIMKKLEHIAELEQQYLFNLAIEQAQGIDSAKSRRPFLKSRMILRQIKQTLHAARTLEERHNMNPRYVIINIVEDTIFGNDIFIEAKRMISNKGNMHPSRVRLKSPAKQASQAEEAENVARMQRLIDQYNKNKTVETKSMIDSIIRGAEEQHDEQE